MREHYINRFSYALFIIMFIAGETPIERELRLRREAQERLRAKFGAGGINAQAVGSSAWVNPDRAGVTSDCIDVFE